MSLTTSRGSRRASRLEDSEIHLLTLDDVPGWMLMRKASMTQEWRERLTAALPSEHFGMNDMKRFGEIFPELPINEHGESEDNSRRPRNDNAGSSSSVSETRRHIAPTSIPQRSRDCHEWADTESVDDETDVNPADLQASARSELLALSAGVDDFPAICPVFTHEESSKLETAAMELGALLTSLSRQRQNEGEGND